MRPSRYGNQGYLANLYIGLRQQTLLWPLTFSFEFNGEAGRSRLGRSPNARLCASASGMAGDDVRNEHHHWVDAHRRALYPDTQCPFLLCSFF